MTTTEVSGRVTKIEKGETKSGKPMWKVFVDGCESPLFVWFWNVISKIKVGMGGRFDVEDRNGFLHVIKGEPTSPEEQLVSELEPPATGSATAGHVFDKKDWGGREGQPSVKEYKKEYKQDNPFITRMSCLKTAVDYLGLHPENPSIEDVIAVAVRLADYVENGE